MPSPDRTRLDAIREAARLAVEAGSLRAVARAVGLSPMGLKHFLAGKSDPYSATVRKLNDWYVAHGPVTGSPVDVSRSALDVLLQGIPPRGRRRASVSLLDHVAKIHREMRTEPPAWVAALRDENAE
jgi:hypothetical protein